MYDTIKCYYSFEENHKPPLDMVMKNLKSIKEHNDRDTGSFWISANASNLRISYNERSLSIQGSLPKYYYGNNFKTLNRSTAAYSIEQLSDLISVDLLNAKVSRVDVSTNLITKFDPKYYYEYLGHLPRYKRVDNGTSLYYFQKTKNLLFYDKTKWAKDAKQPVPKEFQNKNIFRYELAIKKDVHKFFSNPIYLKDLLSRNTYHYMIDEWLQHYQNIQKQNNKIEIMTELIKSPKDFDNQLLTGIVKSLGYEYIDKIIEKMKLTKTFNHKEYYSILKNKYKKLSKINIEPTDIINEINEKIEEVVLSQKST